MSDTIDDDEEHVDSYDVDSYISDVFEDLYRDILQPYMDRNVDGMRKPRYREALKKFRKEKRKFVRNLRRQTPEDQEAAAMEYYEENSALDQAAYDAFQDGGKRFYQNHRYLNKRMRPFKR